METIMANWNYRLYLGARLIAVVHYWAEVLEIRSINPGLRLYAENRHTGIGHWVD